ncbi:ROK family protein [Salinicoccus albus]|uniref:ROK family protein n=1 Tax=Salinicoccus albus TaxID=418756 RepID=UPI0003824033|nr:ROK family protein [Salinicoccus albus]
MIGAIEAGGTKFVCAVLDDNSVLDRVTIPTAEPETTMNAVYQFFEKYDVEAVGIGAFGPINLDRNSANYGMIQNTPKLEWQYYPLLNEVQKAMKRPVAIDTDVNTASLGEYHFGSAKRQDSCLYITVGTGIGGGFVKNGDSYIGQNHPEMGHVFINQMNDDGFIGICPSHGSCLEGLVSGPAIEKRMKQKAVTISANDPLWETIAYYIAQALVNYTLVLSPAKIVIGGGVMKQMQLYPLIKESFTALMNGYIKIDDIDQFIVPPELNDDQGILGAAVIAKEIIA